MYNPENDLKSAWKWTAPEALCFPKTWTIACDVWSYGVFCWELYTDCVAHPYSGTVVLSGERLTV